MLLLATIEYIHKKVKKSIRLLTNMFVKLCICISTSYINTNKVNTLLKGMLKYFVPQTITFAV